MFTMEVDDDIKLALVQPSFAQRYLDIVANQKDDLGQWLAWPLHADSADFFLTFITQSLRDYAQGKSMTCAILYQNQVVGNVSFNTINHQLKKVEIGYWLSEQYRGLGIVSRVVEALIRYAFSDLKMQKVQISAAVDNQASRRVCERAGLTLEGIITNAENLNGRIVDHAVYGLRRAEGEKQ